MLYQKDRPQNAIILEIKMCRDNEFIEDAAKRALNQINEKRYDAEAVQMGYKKYNKVRYSL